jgi:hypothetical protein
MTRLLVLSLLAACGSQPPAPSLPSNRAAAEPPPSPIAKAEAILRRISQGELKAPDLMTEQFAFVDYTSPPEGGPASTTERLWCDRMERLTSLSHLRPRIESAFADEAVKCFDHDRFVYCELHARDEHEQALTFAFSTAPDVRLTGVARRETFMIEDDARLQHDAKRRDAAFATLTATPCPTGTAMSLDAN